MDRTVTLSGVVTAAFAGMQGFFLQDPAGDGRAETSDGIFVFGVSTNLPLPSSLVRVTGRVIEFARAGYAGSVTEIDLRNGGSFEVIGSSPLPQAVILNPLSSEPAALEPFEGMLAAYPASVAVSPSTRFGEYFAVRWDRLPATVRLFPWTRPDVVPLMIDQSGGAFRKEVQVFDLVPDLVGVLHFDFGSFRLEPVADYDVRDAGFRPTAATAVSAGSPGQLLRVAFLNCQRVVWQLPAVALERKLEKLALAIRDHLRLPEIVAVAEVEDQQLLEALGARAGPYQAVLLKGCDFSNINVGVLYRQDRLRKLGEFQLQAEAPEFRNGACTLPDGRAFRQFLYDRPPLLVDFAWGEMLLTVIVNHWRSRIGGNEAERIASAEYLSSEIQRLGRENLIVLGDFNDTEDSPSLLILSDRTGMANLTWSVPEMNRYSFVFGGISQVLDHIFVSPALLGMVRWSGIAHFNADFPASLADRGGTALRVSDHDAPYIVLQ